MRRMSDALVAIVSALGFLVGFATLWCAVNGLLAVLSGWRSFAGEFRARQPPTGRPYKWVSGRIGAFVPVNYRSVLGVAVDVHGFELSVMPLFALFSPRLRIPWTKVESVVEKKFLWMRYVVVTVRGYAPRIELAGLAGEAVEAAYRQAGTR
jgi:hypothetical protein